MLDSMSPATISRMQQSQEELGPGPGATAATIARVLYLSNSAARRLLGVSALEGLAPGTAGRTLDAKLVVSRVPTPYPARNVIGILPGRDPSLRGQFVAIGAHNDHEGLAPRPLDHDSVLANNMVIRRQGVQDAVRQPTADEAARIAQLRDSLTRAHGGARPDSVYNGADDDGSGTVAMLEIAERFATAPERPRRSLIFVSHTGEEKGLWGSQWFTDHPTVPRDSIVAQLNMDMVGRGKATDIMGRGPNNIQLIGPRRLSSQLGATIDSVNAARTPHMDIDTSFDTNGHPLNRYCRSDHYMYRPLQHSHHVLLARLSHGLPSGDRRAAIHRLRTHGAHRVIRARHRRGGGQSSAATRGRRTADGSAGRLPSVGSAGRLQDENSA